MNKESLLNDLKINREPVKARRGERRPIGGWIAGAVAILALAGALIWFLIARPDLPRVEVAPAKSMASGVEAQRGSLLDASGYVVARRQATVSSKITRTPRRAV